MTWLQAGLLLALSVLLGTGAAAFLILLRARLAQLSPAGAKAASAPLPANLEQGLADLVAVRAEWAAMIKQLDAYFDALEDQSETVERRRRRTVSAKQRAEEAEARSEPGPRDELAAVRSRARAQGIPV